MSLRVAAARAVLLAAALAGPGAALAADGAGAADAAADTAANTAAKRRDVLRGVLQLRDVSLTVHASCVGVGAHAADRTVGDYVAGLLAEMNEPSNTVSAECRPGPGGSQRCEVWFRHRDNDDRWAWGLRFEMDSAHRPLARSVQCLGAG